MPVLLLLGCAAFGAADQYVGSLTRFWVHAWEVPALSAPWLLLPFVIGCTQRSPQRAAVLGAGGTLVALLGYGLMTISPIEHAHLSVASLTEFARSNALWFLGSAVTGPLFGRLGHRWHVARARHAAAVAAGAVLLEPLVHAAPHPGVPLGSIPFGAVTGTELLLGIGLAAWFAWQRRQSSVPA